MAGGRMPRSKRRSGGGKMRTRRTDVVFPEISAGAGTLDAGCPRTSGGHGAMATGYRRTWERSGVARMAGPVVEKEILKYQRWYHPT